MIALHRRLSRLIPVLAFLVVAPGSRLTAQCLTTPGDMNNDSLVNTADISPLVTTLLAGGGNLCADTNGDAAINGLDIACFVRRLISGPPGCISSPTTQSDYEPGPLSTPPASTCNETHCGGGGDQDVIASTYLATGEFYHTVVDMTIRGRGLDFIWARKYRSRFGPNTDMGNGWDFSYNIYLQLVGQQLLLHDGNSRQDLYNLQPNGKWAKNEFFREIEDLGSSYVLTFADGGKWEFNPITGNPQPSAGKLKSIIDRNGNTMFFQYGPQGRLQTVFDSLNRSIQIAYNANNLISTVTDFTGRQIVYEYYQSGDAGGDAGDLKSARSPIVSNGVPANHNNYPAGKLTLYTYSKNLPHPSLNSNLLTITDPKGQVYLTNAYDPTTNPLSTNFDRLTRQIWGNPNDQIDVVYVPQTPAPANNFSVMRTIVNDRGTSTPPATTPSASNVREFFYDSRNRLVMRHDYTGRATANQPTTATTNRPTAPLRLTDPVLYETRWSYNDDAMPTLVTFPNLNSIANTYELALNPGAPRRTRGNLRQKTSNGSFPATLTESMTYEPGLGGCGCGSSFVKTHTDARGNTTTHTYDIHGNRTHTDHRLGGGVEDWTYNAFGQVLTHTHPANPDGHRRVDAYVYYGPGPQNGYLQSETIDDPGLKLTTTYEYDSRGNVTRITSPRGNAIPPEAGQDTLITYNDLDQPIYEQSRVVGSVRYVRKMWYDANDNLARVDRQNVDQNGVVQPNAFLTTIHDYEILNRIVATVEEKGLIAPADSVITSAGLPPGQVIRTSYNYDPNRNRSRTLNPQAAAGQSNDTVDTEFDERDLVYRTIRSKGDALLKHTTQTDYDGNGNPLVIKSALEDGFSRVTTNVYDGHNRLIRTTDPMGNVTFHTYDANGNRTNTRLEGELNDVPGGAGNVRLSETTSIFDFMDRQTDTQVAHFNVATQAAIGDGFSTTTTSYGHNGQVNTVINDRGFLSTIDYDTANRARLSTDAMGNSIQTNFDAASNVKNTLETELPDLPGPAVQFLTSHTYDGLDRRLSTTDSGLNTHSRSYDSRGNVATATDARGTMSRFVYDSYDRQTQSILDMDGDGPDGDGTDITLGTAWTDNSAPSALTDGNNNATGESYNARNEPTQTSFADGCTANGRTYDVHGNLLTSVDARGTSIIYTYDLLNRLTQKSITPGPGVANDTTLETFTYDGAGRLTSAANNLSTVTRTYDSLGNILVETQNVPASGGGRTITCTYDGLNNKLTQLTPGRNVTMTYDALNRLKTIGDNFVPFIASYDYIGPARVLRRTYQPGTPNETRCDYEYDAARRVTRTRHTRSVPGDLDNRQYTWDPNSNKNSRTINPASGSGHFQSLFQYDRANRLIDSNTTDLAGPNNRQNIYNLDKVGNRFSVLGSNTLDPGPYAMTPGCEPADFEMNQYSITPLGGRNYDTGGNLIAWNLASPDAGAAAYDYANRMVASTIGGVTTHYRYDALGRRLVKCVGVCGAPGATTTRFSYDGWREVHAMGGGLGVASFVHGRDIDEVLTMRRGASNYFYHGDDLHNVIALTDASGNIAERYEYDDYGRPLDAVTMLPFPGNPSTSLISNPFLFNGRRYDVETGWYDYRTRYLDPRAGRFTTRDSIGIWGDLISKGNGFTYVGNNPGSSLDPLGLAKPRKEIDLSDRLAWLAIKVVQKNPVARGILIIVKLGNPTPPEEGAELVFSEDTKDKTGTFHEVWVTTDNLLVPVSRRHGNIDNLDAIKADIKRVRDGIRKEAADAAAIRYQLERERQEAIFARREALANIRFERYLEEFNKDYPELRSGAELDPATLLKWSAKLGDLNLYIDVHSRTKMLPKEAMERLREIRGRVEKGTYRP